MADDKTPPPTRATERNPPPGQPVPPPEDDVLPGFPDAVRVRSKTPYPGGRRRRWEGQDGTIYEWDYQHGTVEKYNRRGDHLGEFDPVTGEQKKDADPKRRVEP